MKIYEVAKICNKQKQAHLINRPNEQWAGVPEAMYCLHGFPRLSEDQLLRVLDVPVNELGSFSFKATLIDDSFEHEFTRLQATPILGKTANIKGLLAFEIGDNLEFISETYLKPIGGIDKANDYRFFDIKNASNPHGFIVVFDGMMPIAAIAKYNCLTQELVDQFADFTNKIAVTLAMQEQRARGLEAGADTTNTKKE